jgi:hypothetical protein
MVIFPFFRAGTFCPLHMLEVGREYIICDMQMYGTPTDPRYYAILQDSFETLITELRAHDYECLERLTNNVMLDVNTGWLYLRVVLDRITEWRTRSPLSGP